MKTVLEYEGERHELKEPDIVERLREIIAVTLPQAESVVPVAAAIRRMMVERAEAADEIERLRYRVEELEREAGDVAAEFEGDLSVVMRHLLTECNFDFDGDGWTADTAYQFLHDTLQDMERIQKRQAEEIARLKAAREALTKLLRLTKFELEDADNQRRQPWVSIIAECDSVLAS